MKVISFVNMKGGVGKTTLAVNVADVLSQRHDKRVLLVDVDPQFNATQSLLSGESYLKLRQSGSATVYDIFSQNDVPIISAVSGPGITALKKLEDIKPTKIKTNFDLIPGNLEIYRIEMVAGQGTEMRLKSFLKKNETKYDYAIIDTPPTPSVFMSSALLASNFYVVPIKPEPMSRIGIDLLRGVINRISENNAHNIECAGVVITMAAEQTLVYKDCLKELKADATWKSHLIRNNIPQRTVIAREQGHQKLISDVGDVDSKRALAGVVKELMDRTDD